MYFREFRRWMMDRQGRARKRKRADEEGEGEGEEPGHAKKGQILSLAFGYGFWGFD